MATSGTHDWTLDNSSILLEAFDRATVRPTALTRDQIMSGNRSLNLELLSWSNMGINLWKVEPFTIQLVASQDVYTAGTGVTNIPAATVTMLDVFLSQIDGGGAGINIDRIMIPMSRTVYDETSNKLEPGMPTMFWYQKLRLPTLTIYQPPLEGYPTYQLGGHLMLRIEDSNLGGSDEADVDILGLDALCARLAVRLARKFMPDKVEGLKEDAKEALMLFIDQNREDSPITILPQSIPWGQD